MFRHSLLNTLACLSLGLLLLTPVSGRELSPVTANEPPQSVLFIGNSLTMYNNAVYTHLRRLLTAENPANRQGIFLKSVMINGAFLADHRGGLEYLLNKWDFDVVVLQGHSQEAINATMVDGFRSATREYVQLIRSDGGRPVLFMTWAYADRPEMSTGLVAGYERLGADLGVEVVPVGLAFARAIQDVPGVQLHVEDGIHPSLQGTYLTAAVFYAALYGKSPADLAYTAGLDETLARQLRSVAWRTVREYDSH
jgi:hypothetical protein